MDETLLSQLYLKETEFHNLMQERVYNVLLIASDYDAFMLEEDGRVEEQIFMEYVSLNLSSPPRVTRVRDYDSAFQALAKQQFNLTIAMPGVDISDTFSKAVEFKTLYPDVPFVVLTPFSREVSRRLEGEDFS
ncbi:MAG: phosphoenolpyruvate synthase, partial [Bacteroidales bacterium]|nr:phosphoenolpyruvate synthase [Candidatus Sodaliphilus fimicaballi]